MIHIIIVVVFIFFFFSSRRRHTRCSRDWSSDVCSSDLVIVREITPTISVRGIILTDGAPLPFGQIRPPSLPVFPARRVFGQAAILGSGFSFAGHDFQKLCPVLLPKVKEIIGFVSGLVLKSGV